MSYSAAHTISLVPGSTMTTYHLMEEYTNVANPLLLGNFNGALSGEIGIIGTDFSFVLGVHTTNATTQFLIHGITLAYIPIPVSKETLRFQIVATDNQRLSSNAWDNSRGVDKLRELYESWANRRPVYVLHPYMEQDITAPKIMYITNYQDQVPDPNWNKMDRTGDYPNLEGTVTIELVEC
jgi:hypothetical protein